VPLAQPNKGPAADANSLRSCVAPAVGAAEAWRYAVDTIREIEMYIHILHSGLLGPTTDPYNDRNQFDAGRYAFSVISASRWGRDKYLMQGGHDQHSPDVIIAHSSVFEFDLLRMLRFILSTRARAPWIVYVLLLSTDEEKEVASFPTPIRDHFSRYFQVARAQFSMTDIHEYVASNFQKIE